jgi:hypothetical protein
MGERETPAQADRLGMCAKWAREFGYISILDPTTGTWIDLPTKEAPDWAVREARKRREIRKHGGINRFLTSREIAEHVEPPRDQAPEGIVETHPDEVAAV